MICKPHKNESKFTKTGLVWRMFGNLFCKEKSIRKFYDLLPVPYRIFFWGVAKRWRKWMEDNAFLGDLSIFLSVGTWIGLTANMKTNFCDKGSSSSSSSSSSPSPITISHQSSSSSSSVHHFSCPIRGEEHAQAQGLWDPNFCHHSMVVAKVFKEAWTVAFCGRLATHCNGSPTNKAASNSRKFGGLSFGWFIHKFIFVAEWVFFVSSESVPIPCQSKRRVWPCMMWEVPIKATLFTASFNIFEAHQLTNLLSMEEILHRLGWFKTL